MYSFFIIHTFHKHSAFELGIPYENIDVSAGLTTSEDAVVEYVSTKVHQIK